MSFTRKRIDITITLGKGQVGADGYDTIKLTGHRTVVNIAKPLGDSMGALQMRVYGMNPDLMHRLTTIGPIATAVRMQNAVTISAGDDQTGMSQIYVGTISQAWGDYQSPPDVAFNVIGLCGLVEALKPVPPVSYKGQADVATIMSGLAKQMGVGFENNGVTVQLNDPYFPGTSWQQVQACARAADIRYALDNGTLAIWPKTGARAGGVPLISPETGLVGYPAFSSNSLILTTTFNPNIVIGGKVKVQSAIPMACGTWNVLDVSHAIESERPGGAWFTRLQCFPDTPTGTT
ncbi:baseplate hub protein [Burkholderia multivorans]|uniref:baseplate hub protein n=1 Tax=Burkholderia multivorans TaxID=87883 RepID=UPI000665756F|nr:hypothetical protein [Burkholderia multivorans]